MEAIVHYPKTAETQRAFHNKIAAVHAGAILTYIDKLSCPKAQKLQLVKDIAQSFADKA